LIVRAGQDIPSHTPPGDATIHCLEGAIDFRVGDRTRRLAAGQMLYLAAGTVHAVRGVEPVLVRAAESLGARRGQLFVRVVLPAALPEILTGIRVSVALAFFVIVIAEFVGAERGLGYLINDGRNFFLVPQMLGAAVVLGLLGSAASFLVSLVERRWLRWERPSTS